MLIRHRLAIPNKGMFFFSVLAWYRISPRMYDDVESTLASDTLLVLTDPSVNLYEFSNLNSSQAWKIKNLSC